MVQSAAVILDGAAARARERESGQGNIFGAIAESQSDVRLAQTTDWPAHERLSEEFSAMGFYLSGHPLDAYAGPLKRLGATTYASLLEDRRRSGFKAKLAGTMIRKSERRGRNDQNYAFVAFSDPTGMFEMMLFPEVLTASRHLLEAGKSVLITASAEWEGDELKLRAAVIADLDAAAAQAGEGLTIKLAGPEPLSALVAAFQSPGKGIVTIIVPGGIGEEVEIELPKRQNITVAMKNNIRNLPGVLAVESL
jgi:DNA polymerase-3 subunit alpha